MLAAKISGALVLVFALCLPTPARAAGPAPADVSQGADALQDADLEDEGDGQVAHALSFAARAGNPGYGGLLSYRARLRHGIGIGVEFEANYAPLTYIGGYPAEQDLVLAGRVPLFFPVHRSRRLTMALNFTPGLRSVHSYDPGFAERSGLSVTVDLGVMAYLHLHRHLTVAAGFNVPVAIQVDPIVDIDQLGTLLVVGPVVPINERLSWYASFEAGGLYGSDGDSGKFLVRGTTGLRLIFGASARRWRSF